MEFPAPLSQRQTECYNILQQDRGFYAVVNEQPKILGDYTTKGVSFLLMICLLWFEVSLQKADIHLLAQHSMLE